MEFQCRIGVLILSQLTLKSNNFCNTEIIFTLQTEILPNSKHLPKLKPIEGNVKRAVSVLQPEFS